MATPPDETLKQAQNCRDIMESIKTHMDGLSAYTDSEKAMATVHLGVASLAMVGFNAAQICTLLTQIIEANPVLKMDNMIPAGRA